MDGSAKASRNSTIALSSGNQGADQGCGNDESHLDAEGLLERERRWMEAIFAASRPDDLRCAMGYVASMIPNGGEVQGESKQ